MQVSSANWVFFKFPKEAFYVLSLERSWTVFPRSLILPESASWMPGHHKCCLSVVSLMWQMNSFSRKCLLYTQVWAAQFVCSRFEWSCWAMESGARLAAHSQKSCGPAGVSRVSGWFHHIGYETAWITGSRFNENSNIVLQQRHALGKARCPQNVWQWGAQECSLLCVYFLGLC